VRVEHDEDMESYRQWLKAKKKVIADDVAFGHADEAEARRRRDTLEFLGEEIYAEQKRRSWTNWKRNES
jgi:hypothetical protein